MSENIKNQLLASNCHSRPLRQSFSEAKRAGIQYFIDGLDPRFRGDDRREREDDIV